VRHRWTLATSSVVRLRPANGTLEELAPPKRYAKQAARIKVQAVRHGLLVTLDAALRQDLSRCESAAYNSPSFVRHTMGRC
jgi:hypothetical protein